MASVKALLYTHKTLKDGSHPILISIIKDLKRKTISLGHSASPSQWNKKQKQPNSRHPNQSLLIALIKSKVNDLEAIILELENKKKPFTVQDIVDKYNGIKTDLTLKLFVEKLLSEFKEIGKLGNASVYEHTHNTFQKYTKEHDYPLSEIDYSLIKGFENYLISTGIKINTISMHLRTIRAIINRAIKAGLIEETQYPFKNISVKSEKTRKRAVNKAVIKMVEDMKIPKELNLQLYKDMFMFSFYNRGMNFVDMAFLKVKNIESGRINYTRHKTGQFFSIKITEKAQTIIDYYSKSKEPDDFIFPIIYRKGNEYLDYRNGMRLMNKKLKDISKELKLDVSLTTYVTRHSWATIAKKSGISTAVISEGLGHESEETTQVYLDSFETNVLDDANDLVIS
ncbi:MAG TPA: hypothetical protein DHV48_07710 [Prolixibacteraceae bacterium]|nr:hypothetical protein [Prolixibacteraceae bacterium]